MISAAKKKRPAKMGKFRKYLYTPEKHQRKKRGQQTQAWTKEGELELEEECAPYTRWVESRFFVKWLRCKVIIIYLLYNKLTTFDLINETQVLGTDALSDHAS